MANLKKWKIIKIIIFRLFELKVLTATRGNLGIRYMKKKTKQCDNLFPTYQSQLTKGQQNVKIQVKIKCSMYTKHRNKSSIA